MESGSDQKVKFLAAYFSGIVKKGEEFASGKLPLHITTFPPVEQMYDVEFGVRMRKALNPLPPFVVQTGDIDMFGDNRDILVRKIEHSWRLIGLHALMFGVLGDLRHDPTYRQPYVPHVTLSYEEQISHGEKLLFGGLSVVQKFEDGPWKVLDKIGFKDGKQ